VVPSHVCLRDPCGSEGLCQTVPYDSRRRQEPTTLCGGPAPPLAFLLRPHDNPL
jgi:hypothetical protein